MKDVVKLLKFIYSEKATKFCEIFTLFLSYVVPVKSKAKISQIFVAFSEYMNFTIKREFILINLNSKKSLHYVILAGAASDDLKFEAKPDSTLAFPLRVCSARIYEVSYLHHHQK